MTANNQAGYKEEAQFFVSPLYPDFSQVMLFMACPLISQGVSVT